MTTEFYELERVWIDADDIKFDPDYGCYYFLAEAPVIGKGHVVVGVYTYKFMLPKKKPQ